MGLQLTEPSSSSCKQSRDYGSIFRSPQNRSLFIFLHSNYSMHEWARISFTSIFFGGYKEPGQKSALVKERKSEKSLKRHKSLWIGFSCLFFLPPNNREWVENVDQIAFFKAATKQAGQHMADRPPTPISSICARTGTISQNLYPNLHFRKCAFKPYCSHSPPFFFYSR